MADKASKMARYSAPDESGGRTCPHKRYGDSDRCAEMVCWNYYMKGGGFWNDDELPGMWETPDFSGGKADTEDVCPCGSETPYYSCDCAQRSGIGPSLFKGVKVPEELRPNWFDNRVEVSWWKSGVRSALEGR